VSAEGAKDSAESCALTGLDLQTTPSPALRTCEWISKSAPGLRRCEPIRIERIPLLASPQGGECATAIHSFTPSHAQG